MVYELICRLIQHATALNENLKWTLPCGYNGDLRLNSEWAILWIEQFGPERTPKPCYMRGRRHPNHVGFRRSQVRHSLFCYMVGLRAIYWCYRHSWFCVSVSLCFLSRGSTSIFEYVKPCLSIRSATSITKAYESRLLLMLEKVQISRI